MKSDSGLKFAYFVDQKNLFPDKQRNLQSARAMKYDAFSSSLSATAYSEAFENTTKQNMDQFGSHFVYHPPQ